MTRKPKCVICGDTSWPDGVHNAAPVKHGLCCGICNVIHVIPARIQRSLEGRDPREVRDDV